jgi:SAM-dependent methyltransferase
MNPHDAEPVDELLAAAYALDGPEASRTLYARWAATYETNFVAASGYRYHEHVARIFAEHCRASVGPEEAVLDVGCGTGLAGQALRALDPVLVDGLDISPEMLGEAAAKRVSSEPVYRHLVEADLTRSLPIPDATYAGALSVGTFTHGHVGPEALHEVIRVMRPGARLAIGVNAAHFTSTGFAAILDALVTAGRITDLDYIDTPIYLANPDVADLTDPTDLDQIGRVAVFTVAEERLRRSSSTRTRP